MYHVDVFSDSVLPHLTNRSLSSMMHFKLNKFIFPLVSPSQAKFKVVCGCAHRCYCVH